MSERAQNLRKLSPFLYRTHASFRAWQQERRIAKEAAIYAVPSGRIPYKSPLGEEKIKENLQNRLTSRGIPLGAKKKGDLHIVYATRPSRWEPHNIPHGLSKVGDISEYYWADRNFDDHGSDWLEQRDRMNEDLLSFVHDLHRQKPVDAFFGYMSGWQVDRETILQIGKWGIATFGFHWDDKLWFRGKWSGGRWSGPAEVASAYDVNLTNAPDSICKYEVEGGLGLFWPPGGNPDHFRPLDLPFEYDVSFVGACYGFRPILIEFLRRNGIRVETFGPGWPNGTASEEEMIQIYAKSRINLGFGGIGYSLSEQCLKGRDFEVPMCGTLYLTSQNPELDLVFQEGKEILTYSDQEDCLEKIRYFLNHPDEAAQNRKAARRRCLQDHTWERRFGRIFAFAGMMDEGQC